MAATTARRVKVDGERGIYLRPGTSPVVYEITWSEGGRQHWRTVEGGLREARAARGDAVAKLARGERVARSKLTLGEYADEWIETQRGRLRPKTISGYETHLRLHVLPKLGRRRIASVSTDDVVALIGAMQAEGLAAWSIRGTLTTLSRVLGNAERRGQVAANVVKRLERGERPRVAKREIPSLTREDIGRLIAATPAKYRTLLALSVLTGIRQSEALGLRWRDIDVREGLIRVRFQLDRQGNLVPPKTDAGRRDVPLPASLARLLAEHRLASVYSADDDFVFCTSRGTPLGHRNVVRRGLEPALRASGLPRLNWHGLRHVAASLLIFETDGDADHVSRVLGHASAAVTLTVYAHEFERVQRADRLRERLERSYGAMLDGKGLT